MGRVRRINPKSPSDMAEEDQTSKSDSSALSGRVHPLVRRVRSQKWTREHKDAAAEIEARERLLSALLQPTIEMMLRSGIARMSCGKDKGFVLQMETGEVIEVAAPNE